MYSSDTLYFHSGKLNCNIKLYTAEDKFLSIMASQHPPYVLFEISKLQKIEIVTRKLKTLFYRKHIEKNVPVNNEISNPGSGGT